MNRIFLILFVFLFLMAQLAYAHPPEAIKAEYDVENGKLLITIVHPVSNPDKHYIEKVTMTKNGESVTSAEFTRQTDQNVQRVDFTVPGLTPADEVIIEARCNMYGTLAEEVVILDANRAKELRLVGPTSDADESD